jgi:hypothetical protein
LSHSPLTPDRLDRIESIARTLLDDYALGGRWRWTGTPERPHLTTVGHGRMFVLGAEVGHSHHRVYQDAATEPDRVACPAGDGGADCQMVTDQDEWPVGHGAQKFGFGEAEDAEEPYDEYISRHGLLLFPSGNDHSMRSTMEIPIFEVDPEAISSASRAAYRPDVVGFRSAAADWFAEIDPETVLALVLLARRASTDEVRAEGNGTDD